MLGFRNAFGYIATVLLGLSHVGCSGVFSIDSLSAPAEVSMTASAPLWDSGDLTLKSQIFLELKKDIPTYVGVTPVVSIESVSGLGLWQKSLSSLGLSSHSMASLAAPTCTPFDAAGKSTCDVSSSDEGEVQFQLLEPKFSTTISLSMVFYPAPILNAISPTSVGHNLEQTITLAGEKFREGVKVFIDGTTECTNVVRLAATTLTCKVPVLTVGAKTVSVQNVDLQESATVNMTVYDATPPHLEWVSPAIGTQAQTQLDVELECEVGLPVQFSGAGLLASFSASCDTGTLTRSIFFSSGEGTKVITVTQTRNPGAVTTTRSRNFIRDNTPPSIAVTTPATSPFHYSTGSATLSGTCEVGLALDVTVNGAAGPAVTCDGTGHWTTMVNPMAEGEYTYQFKQTDAAGNIGEASVVLVKDLTVPDLKFANGLGTFTVTTAGNFYIFSGACESPFAVTVSGQDTASVACSNGSWSYQTAAQTVDQTYSYQFRQQDLAGNQKIISSEWTRNTQGPVLTVTGSSIVRTAETTHVFSGNCEIGLSITVSGAESTSLSCPAGTWSHTTGSLAEGTHDFTFSQTNMLAVSTSVSASWIRDVSAPVADLLEVIGGSPIAMPYAKLRLRAADAAGNVTGFCVKVDSATAPAANASCWESVSQYTTPAATVTISSYDQLIGFAAGTYTVYVWWRDDLGNQSSSSSSLPVTYTPIPPPTVSTVLASNSTTFDGLKAEREIAAGQTVNIKWKASGTNLSATPVSIYFTTDDVEWTLVKANLLNGINGSCILDGPGSKDDDVTGCYTWANSSPLNSYYRLRVSVANTFGSVVFANSAPINAESLDLIAGNTESGTGGTAFAAVFASDPSSQATVPKTRSLVITQKGVVYINDFRKGILTIDQSTGFLKTFLPKKTTCVVNDELTNVATSCVRHGAGIVLDQNEDLLVHDGDRIRKVYLSQTPQRIETIIGGGTDSSDGVTDPLQYKFADIPAEGIRADYFSYKVLPNNDIILILDAVDHRSMEMGGGARLYSSATKTLSRLNLAGTGASHNASQDITKCGLVDVGFSYTPGSLTVDEFFPFLFTIPGSDCESTPTGSQVQLSRLDPQTYQVDTSTLAIPTGQAMSFGTRSHVGKNGKTYSFVRSQVKEYVPNGSGGSYVSVLGTGVIGHCAVATNATSCKIDIDDIYVSRNGTLFFLTRNAIRMVDSTGVVRDVFGQAVGTGDGLLAKDVRFGMVSTFDRSPAGKIAIYESGSFKIREFEEGGVLTTLIGNGAGGSTGVGAANPSVNQPLPLVSTAYDVANMFYVGNDDIVFNANLYRLGLWKRSLGYATYMSGTGTVDYRLAESSGQPDDRLAINLTYQPPGFGTASRILPIGSYNGTLLSAARGFTSVEIDSNLILYDSADSYRMTTLMRAENNDTPAALGLCADGTELLKCATALSQGTNYLYAVASYSTADSGWIVLHRGEPRRVALLVPGGNMATLVTLQQNATSVARASHNGREYVFYCSESSKQLRRVDITNPAMPVEAALPWEIPSWQCYGRSLNYNVGADGPRLLFQLEQNGLFGIAEYLDPYRTE
ncbi:IPT/TIG domain protein [compost metagenome]